MGKIISNNSNQAVAAGNVKKVSASPKLDKISEAEKDLSKPLKTLNEYILKTRGQDRTYLTYEKYPCNIRKVTDLSLREFKELIRYKDEFEGSVGLRNKPRDVKTAESHLASGDYDALPALIHIYSRGFQVTKNEYILGYLTELYYLKNHRVPKYYPLFNMADCYYFGTIFPRNIMFAKELYEFILQKFNPQFFQGEDRNLENLCRLRLDLLEAEYKLSAEITKKTISFSYLLHDVFEQKLREFFGNYHNYYGVKTKCEYRKLANGSDYECVIVISGFTKELAKTIGFVKRDGPTNTDKASHQLRKDGLHNIATSNFHDYGDPKLDQAVKNLQDNYKAAQQADEAAFKKRGKEEINYLVNLAFKIMLSDYKNYTIVHDGYNVTAYSYRIEPLT
ncbi:MAG: hypothetical protein ACI4MQ_03615 [Candidatus Coproplasma sp.]